MRRDKAERKRLVLLLKSGMILTTIDEAIIDGVEAYEVKCDFWETTYWLDKNLFNENKE
mgnify:CR=1 FL=1